MRRTLVMAALMTCLAVARGAPGQEAGPAATPTARAATATDQGIALFKQRKFPEAKLLLGKAVALDPKDAAAQAYLGLVLRNYDADLEHAAAHLEEAVRLEPGSARYHQWLGDTYGLQAGSAPAFKQDALAKKCRGELEKAVEVGPNDVDARMALLQFYLGAPAELGGSVEQARKQALAITGVDRYQGLLAQALVAQNDKDTDRAEQLYRTAIAVAPDKADAYNLLGYLLLGNKKRREEAVAVFRKQVEVAPGQPNPHDSLAEGLLDAGHVREAISEYQKALEIDPGFGSSYLGLANCYEKQRAREAAIDALERFLKVVPNGPQADRARDRIEKLREAGNRS